MKRIHRLHTYLKIDLSKRSLFPSFEILVRAELRTEYVLSHRYFRESEDESERAWRQIALKRRSAITRRAMNNESTRDQSGKRSAPLSLSFFYREIKSRDLRRNIRVHGGKDGAGKWKKLARRK